MKKLSAVLLAGVMCMSMAACGEKKSGEDSDALTDLAYIQDKGTLTVGITLYEPMNYEDENGELTGFDTEFTKAVCEKLGVEPDFQVIDWNKKEIELKSKTIDCIWNGLTVSEDRKEQMSFSQSYVKNRQTAVVKKENADKYKDIASMAGASMVAEDGSAGQTAIESDDTLKNNPFTGLNAQKDTLLEVKAGTADVAVIDYVMANASVGEGTDFDDLVMIDNLGLTPEEYAIGFRLEDTELTAAVDKAIDELAEEGKIQELAEKYGLSDVLAF